MQRLLDQAEPDLAARRKARHRVRQQLERHLRDNRDRRGVQRLGDLDARERRADDHRALRVEHEPRRARRAMPDEAATRVRLDLLIDGAHAETGRAGARQRVADRRDLRLGEDHARRKRTVGAQRARPAEDPVRHEPCLVLAHVRQQRAPVRIADDVQPVAPRHAQPLVDVDRPAALQADRLEPERVRVRLAPRADQQLLAGERAAVLELERDRATRARLAAGAALARRAPNRRRGDAKHDLDAGRFERFAHLLGGEKLLATDQPLGDLEDRHMRAERRVRLRELDRDDTAAEHEQRARDRFRRRRLAVRPRLGLAQPVDRRHRRGAARREHYRAARREQIVADAHAALAVEHAVTAEQRDPTVLEPRQLRGVVEPVDDLIAPREHRGDVELTRRGLRGALDAARLRKRLSRAQQTLRRHARVERAFAADEVLLDERHRQLPFGKAARADLAAGTGADDDHVELTAVAHCPPPLCFRGFVRAPHSALGPHSSTVAGARRFGR